MAESKIYRVRVDRVAAVVHPETGSHVVPDPRQPYEADDVLVREYPWMFATDEEMSVERADETPIESVAIEPPVETATARPGQRSNARRMRASE